MNQHFEKPKKKSLFESFPEDRTVPGHWEFDGLQQRPMIESKSRRNEKALEASLKSKLDTFPTPRTFPGHFDL